MIFTPRARLKPLAAFCRRLAISTHAGLDDRRIWRDEAQRGSAAHRAAVQAVSDRLAQGSSLSAALGAAQPYFPPLFVALAAVGEASGGLDRTYRRLADHYDHAVAARREFWNQMTWPLVQLGLAVGVIGLFIWVLGVVAGRAGAAAAGYDPLGFGLVGTRGLVIYLNGVIALAVAAMLVIFAFLRDARWTRPIAQAALRAPIVGAPLRTLALARFTGALELVLDTPMDLRKALPLAFDATAHDHYRRHGPAVAASIGRGATIAEALALTGVFPRDLIDAVDVGEQAGSLVETMRRQADEYQARAAVAMRVLAQLLGYVAWALVAALIVTLIVRIFSSYTGMLMDLSKPGAL